VAVSWEGKAQLWNGNKQHHYSPARLSHDLMGVPGSLIVAAQNSCEMPTPHWHAQVEINFIYSGGLTYRMSNHDVDLVAGDLCLFWGGQMHRATSVEPETEFVTMHLPLTHFFRLRLPAGLMHQLIGNATLVVPTTGQADRETFLRMSKYMLGGEPSRIEFAIEELLVRLNRIAFEPYRIVGRAVEDEAESSERVPHRTIIRICDYISEHFRETISSADVAASVDIHPKYAMSVFKKSTGMTLNEYITLLRLSYAQSLLLEDEMTILDVAMESGFGSLSAFSQAFRRITGYTASEFRRESNVSRLAAG
jgi:AraC-like DNA-binding protein